MASGAVFESYEILVHVLLSLPLRDLLLSQMINKACFDLVQGSPGIRSALFWKANSSPIHSKEKREVNHTLRFRYFNDEHKKVDAPILNPFVIV